MNLPLSQPRLQGSIVSKHVSFHLSDNMYDRLVQQAAARGTGITGIMLQLIEDFLNQMMRLNERR